MVFVSHFQLRRFCDSVDEQERCIKATVTTGSAPGCPARPWFRAMALPSTWTGVLPVPMVTGVQRCHPLLQSHPWTMLLGFLDMRFFSSKPQSAAGLYQLVVIREQVINDCVVCRVCH